MKQEFELYKEFISFRQRGEKGKGGKGKGRGRGAGPKRPVATSANTRDLVSTESLAGSSSQASCSERNSQSEGNLRKRCAWAEARADALQKELKRVLEENEVLKAEKFQNQAVIAPLKKDWLMLFHVQERAAFEEQLAQKRAAAQQSAEQELEPSAEQEPPAHSGDPAAGDTAVHDEDILALDRCIQSMESF